MINDLLRLSCSLHCVNACLISDQFRNAYNTTTIHSQKSAIGITLRLATATVGSTVGERDKNDYFPSGVACESPSPVKGTLKNTANLTGFHGREVINCIGTEGERSCASHRNVTRYMELEKDVFHKNVMKNHSHT